MSGNFKKEWCEEKPVHLDFLGYDPKDGDKNSPNKLKSTLKELYVQNVKRDSNQE